MDKATVVANELKEKAEGFSETIADKMEEMELDEKFEQAKSMAKEKLDQAQDWVEEKATQAKEASSEFIDKAEDTIENLISKDNEVNGKPQ